MYVQVSFYNSLEEFNLSNHNTNKKHLIFFTKNTIFDLDELNKSNIDFIGGIFENIIYANKSYSKGFIVFELEESSKISFIDDMSNYYIDKKLLHNSKSVVTILDGFSEHTSKFLENIFEDVELGTNIIGGGAGTLTDIGEASLFDNNGLYSDAAFLIILENQIEIAVGTGWDRLDGPHIATSVEGKILKQIDYKSAYDTYMEIIDNKGEKDFSKEEFYNISKNYPLGIIKLNGDSLVRDILTFEDDGSLVLAGEIESNSVINILKGDSTSLIEDACIASKKASKNNSDVLIIFDCVSRLDYLEDSFQKQLDSIIDESSAQEIHGAVSIGEIANDGSKYIYFLNKSCVVGGLCL